MIEHIATIKEKGKKKKEGASAPLEHSLSLPVCRASCTIDRTFRLSFSIP
jgi:hypothetical protein